MPCLVTHTRRSLVLNSVFGLGGIAFLGTAIATIGSSVLEAEVNAVKKAKRQSKQRVMRLFEGMTPKKLGKGRQMRERMLKKQALRRRINFSKQLNDRSKFISEVLVRVLPALSIVVVGGVIMSYLNGSSWSLADSLYYGIVTGKSPIMRKLWDVSFLTVHIRNFKLQLLVLVISVLRHEQRKLSQSCTFPFR